MNKYLKLLLFFVVLGAIADVTLTYLNLRILGFQFESNPFVPNIFIGLLIKTVWLGSVFFMLKNWKHLSLKSRHFLLTALILASIVQLLGAYSHVEQYKTTRHAISVQQSETEVIVWTSPTQYTSFQKPTQGEGTRFYVFFVMLQLLVYPFVVSTLAFYFLLKTSPDYKISKSKNLQESRTNPK